MILLTYTTYCTGLAYPAADQLGFRLPWLSSVWLRHIDHYPIPLAWYWRVNSKQRCGGDYDIKHTRTPCPPAFILYHSLDFFSCSKFPFHFFIVRAHSFSPWTCQSLTVDKKSNTHSSLFISVQIIFLRHADHSVVSCSCSLRSRRRISCSPRLWGLRVRTTCSAQWIGSIRGCYECDPFELECTGGHRRETQRNQIPPRSDTRGGTQRNQTSPRSDARSGTQRNQVPPGGYAARAQPPAHHHHGHRRRDFNYHDYPQIHVNYRTNTYQVCSPVHSRGHSRFDRVLLKLSDGVLLHHDPDVYEDRVWSHLPTDHAHRLQANRCTRPQARICLRSRSQPPRQSGWTSCSRPKPDQRSRSRPRTRDPFVSRPYQLRASSRTLPSSSSGILDGSDRGHQDQDGGSHIHTHDATRTTSFKHLASCSGQT